MTVIQGPSSDIMTSVRSKGRYFFKGDQRFLIKGVVYRLHGEGPLDPLVDDRLDDLQRDITLFKELGLNTLFVCECCQSRLSLTAGRVLMQAADHIDSSRNHNAAMHLLAEAGIYVLISLPTSTCTSDNSGTTTTFRPYNSELLEDCFATIDCMSQYANTLGIIVANGAMSTIYSTSLAPMIKTVIRDVKKYMATAKEITGQRQLPIGYSASTGRLILRTTFDYFTAGKEDETVDFFCYANFNWCGQSTLHISGYKQELKTFDDAHIPVFFSQYGCNLGTCGKRIFQETSAIYSSAMTRVFSGGIAYEFYDSPDIKSGLWGYGLVRQEDSVVGRGVTKLPDFESLRKRLENCQDESIVEEEMEGGDFKPSSGDIPPLSPHWKAGHPLPYSMANWSEVRQSLEGKVWMEVGVEELTTKDFQLSHQPKFIRA